MEYRVNRRTGDRISVLGVGTSGLPAAGAKEGAATLEMALEQGINYFDLATADSACFPIFGAAGPGSTLPTIGASGPGPSISTRCCRIRCWRLWRPS